MRRIFADRHHRAEARVFGARTADFDRVAAEEDALHRQRVGDVHPRQMHRPWDAAIDELHQKFERLGKPQALAAHHAELAGSITGQVLADRRRSVPKFGQAGLGSDRLASLVLAAEQLGQHRIEGAGLPLEGTADNGEIDVIDEHAPLRQRRVVALVEFATQRVVEGRVDARLHLSADDVGGQGKPGIGEGADHVIAAQQPRVDLAHVGGLEGVAVELEDGKH